jgi:hypothetical protein
MDRDKADGLSDWTQWTGEGVEKVLSVLLLSEYKHKHS